MSAVIKVEGIAKRYRIGGKQVPYATLRENVSNAVRGLFRFNRNGSRRAEDYIWALKDVNFEVSPGQVLGIIGRNGAGKSTLLKVLSRITEPTAGRAELRGRVGSLLEVGTGFHPELTGRENIYLNGAILGMSRGEIRGKFDEIVAFAELEKFLDTPVKHYSSGMYMRLAFSVAAHLEPEVLLVDEVLAVGDAAFQKKCLGKIEGISRSGRTVLFVSHNMIAVQSLCTNCLLLTEGTCTQMGDVRTVVDAYMRQIKESDTKTLLANCRRSGTGSVRLENVAVQNLQQERGAPTSGCNLRIEMTVTNTSGTDLDDIDVGLSLHSRFDFPLGLIYSSFKGSLMRFRAGCTYSVVFAMHSPMLTTGQYFLRFRIIRHEQALDYPDAAIPFEVTEDDYYGTGCTLWREWGAPILLDGEWSLQ
jgi:lipopolysaccharide transport system ATP-binding protein